MLGFSFAGLTSRGSSGVAPMVLGNENLGIYLDGASAAFAGVAPKLSWTGTGSTGASGSYYVREPSGGAYDPPPVAGPTLDSRATVQQRVADPYPAFDGVVSTATLANVLGFNGTAGKHWTLAAVVRPDAAGTMNLTAGKLSPSNPSIISFDSVLGIFMGTDAGVCKVGVVTYDDWSAVAYAGTVPYVWPGGFGAWGTIIACGDATANTLEIFINGVSQGVVTSFNTTRRTTDVFGSGKQGGGTYPTKQTLRQALAFRERLTQAKVDALQARFKADHPSLP
jgi:hypothetical protein